MSSPNTEPTNTQGSFFNEEVVHSGVTDADKHSTSVRLEIAPEGTFPEVNPLEVKEDQITIDAVHTAVATNNRRAAQLGKHSPLQREGSYSAVQPGDKLPGFGIVTHRNFELAKEHAKKLDNQ